MKLTNERYEEIKERITDLLEDYGISSFPIDISYLAKCLRLKFVFESTLNRKDQYTYCDVDGAILTDKENKISKVFIADVSTSKEKQNFSICHEIGHFVLEHKEDGPKDINEAEAHFFACYLLAPSCLVMHEELGKILLERESLIPKIFNISLDAATYASNRFRRRKELTSKLRSYERRILELFKDSIDKIVEHYKHYDK